MIFYGLIYLLRENRSAKLIPSNDVILFLILILNRMQVQADMIFAKCHNQSFLL